MDYNLDYEEVGSGSMTLEYDHFKCEAPGCENDATVEWVDNSEYSDPTESSPSHVYSYRCDEHPIKDKRWIVVDL